MRRNNHQSPRQRSYESTTSPRNDSLTHTRKHKRRSKGIEQAWQETAYRLECLPSCRGLSAKERADYPEDRRGRCAVQKMPPTEKPRFCLNGLPNSPRAPCGLSASRGLSVKDVQTVHGRTVQKSSNPQELLPKVVTECPKQLKLLRQDLGELICVTR
jgi:hypothetical protein